MMKLMRDPIERRPVKKAMGEVEPNLVNERHEEEQCNKPSGFSDGLIIVACPLA
jgi:hypothetical protein